MNKILVIAVLIIISILILIGVPSLLKPELRELIEECNDTLFLGQCYHHAFCDSQMPSNIDDALGFCDQIDYPLVNCYTEIARQYNNEKGLEICNRLGEILENKFGNNGTVEYVKVLSCDVTVSRGLIKMSVPEAKSLCKNYVK